MGILAASKNRIVETSAPSLGHTANYLSSDIHGDMRACELCGELLQRFPVLAAAQLGHRLYQRTRIVFALATSGSRQERRTSP